MASWSSRSSANAVSRMVYQAVIPPGGADSNLGKSGHSAAEASPAEISSTTNGDTYTSYRKRRSFHHSAVTA